MPSFLRRGLTSIQEELQRTWDAIRSTRWNLGVALAVLCVFFVIVGNVVLLIAINFWIVTFPTATAAHNSSQIAIQVVALIFLVLLFSIIAVVFTVCYGALPLWHVLSDRTRVRGPWYRLFLLFCSGLSNGVSSLLGVYAMSHTPEFIQAVLLCCIPFSAQAWTVIFIPIERQRNYLSMFFIVSFFLFAGGVLLSSLTAFLHPAGNGETASWAWALLYLASSVLFGLWCVLQRLYLDAVARHVPEEHGSDKNGVVVSEVNSATQLGQHDEPETEVARDAPVPVAVHGREEAENDGRDVSRLQRTATTSSEPGSATMIKKPVSTPTTANVACMDSVYMEEEAGMRFSDVDDEEELPMTAEAQQLLKRQWASHSVDDNAAKVVLLVVGLLFQLLISFLLFPVDAIPWFGTSNTALEAWEGFCDSVDFIFASWMNVRYGLLYSLGYAMSFAGCTYLNEHSPTIASVVLQLAGPITSLVIIIIPQWNVYKDSSSVGQKVGGVILLLAAALVYHLWEQQSLRRLLVTAQDAVQKRQRREHQPMHDVVGVKPDLAHKEERRVARHNSEPLVGDV